MSEPHLLTVPLTPEESRERHVESLTSEVRQPIARLLPALELRSLMLGGTMRVSNVDTCPGCGVTAPPDQPNLKPWLVGSQRIDCEGGCAIGPRELLELLCDDDEKLDSVLKQITVGRPSLRRYFVFELRLNAPTDEKPKWGRRVVGADVLKTLSRLEPAPESVIRGFAVDAADQMVVQSVIRSEPPDALPWTKIPLTHEAQLADVGWHGAALSQPERELHRRRMAG